jgi:hypothetical protein
VLEFWASLCSLFYERATESIISTRCGSHNVVLSVTWWIFAGDDERNDDETGDGETSDDETGDDRIYHI